MSEIKKSIEIGGKTLSISTGKLAGQANSAVLASIGDTVVLATVVSSKPIADLGYFPLTVEYQERLYAGGRIKGSRWVKREGRPTDEEILSARLIDRSIRPLFPKSYKNEVQVIVTVLSVDLENSPDIVGAIAVSAALTSSSIPWQGPISIMRVALSDKDFVAFPSTLEIAASKLDLVVSSNKDAVIMIEAGAKEVSEEIILDGISFAQKEGEKLLNLINGLAQAVGNKKDELSKGGHDDKIRKQIEKLAKDKIADLIKKTSMKKAGVKEYEEIKSATVASFEREEMAHAANEFENLFKEIGREMIIAGTRPDGRKYDEIRALSAEVGVLPRTHGSAIFQRGETQVLAITTLGSQAMEQLIETAEGEESKRYMHHYAMPPYASGETGKVGFPSRREIGHGALAERALIPVIPEKQVFPYTIRVVSEIMSSNGSTSMAAVCGSTLSLMDAGVPITSPVSGIAIGLVVESAKKFIVLSDITGLEDGIGDMDFKVAGTQKGITALQLDVKTLSLTVVILKDALAQAKSGREKIMKIIIDSIKGPRLAVSVFAPKIKVIKIPTEKIGELIGPGGKVIRRLMSETGAQIDVEEDGAVHVSASGEEALNMAVEKIKNMFKEIIPGEIYQGIVKRIEAYGIFVEIVPGKEGMVHISDMSQDFVKSPSDLVKLGDGVQVRVKEIDNLGRINLSMNMDPGSDQKKGNFDRDSAPSRNFSRGRSAGPHFPTSRLVDTKRFRE